MAATFNIQYDKTSVAGLDTGPVNAIVQQALAAWVQRFDYTTGSYTLNVNFGATINSDASLALGSYTTIKPDKYTPVVAPSFGLALAGRSPGPGANMLNLTLNPAYLTGALPVSGALGPIEREIGHGLGIRSTPGPRLTGPLIGAFSSPFVKAMISLYELSEQTAPNSLPVTAQYFGPNSVATFGRVLQVVYGDSETTLTGLAAVDSLTQPASSLQPLDVALLRDSGLPALSDQELGEHQVARLYVAAFGRNADSAGLILQYGALRSGQSLAQIAAGFTASAEYANRYGNLSNAGFVNALYQNVLGRAGDAAGVQNFVAVLDAGNSRSALLAGFADSDEARGDLNGNPNVTYAATAEAQVARVYDTAFGRYADPAGFNLFTQAVISGTSLQQVALSFLASPEFTNRYGASPSDQALVDGLYQNTLQRTPDAAGEALFVQALASGLSRADLLVSFSNSQEHVNLVAQRAGTRDAAGYNVDLQPHLGIIPVVSARVTT